jgi:hypothetical protein
MGAQGGEVQGVYSTDGELIMRQEAYFHYLFGVNEDGFWAALDVRNVSSSSSTTTTTVDASSSSSR